MARKPDIEYVNKYFSYGSEAKVIEFQTAGKKAKTTLPKPLQEEKRSLEVDTVALFGLIVAAFMFVVLSFGLVDFYDTCMEHQAMESYLSQLQDDNILLKHNYRKSYDLDVVRETALALGMVPMDQVKTTVIYSQVPEVVNENTWWNDFVWGLSQLFANA